MYGESAFSIALYWRTIKWCAHDEHTKMVDVKGIDNFCRVSSLSALLMMWFFIPNVHMEYRNVGGDASCIAAVDMDNAYNYLSEIIIAIVQWKYGNYRNHCTMQNAHDRMLTLQILSRNKRLPAAQIRFSNSMCDTHQTNGNSLTKRKTKQIYIYWNVDI